MKDEFEVDLSIGSEDPETQLYLIDFRLTYVPSIGDLPQSRFKNEIEFRSNEILRTKGITGLYDFLHDFVMTHKITTLRRQVNELQKGRWTDTLHLNMHKRSLFIYYWAGRQERNLFEVGVLRPKDKEPSRLGVRWHRDGKEVKDTTVPIVRTYYTKSRPSQILIILQNTQTVSAEGLLMTVTALHAKHILTNVRDVLTTLPIFPAEALTLVTSDTDSFKSHLTVRLTPARFLKIQIEPITGRFALSKPNVQVSQAEQVMNHAKPEDWNHMMQQISRLRYAVLQQEIESRAKSLGWEIMRMMNIDLQIIKQRFGATTRYLTYMRRKSWKKNWIVVVVLGDLGESWWVAEM